MDEKFPGYEGTDPQTYWTPKGNQKKRGKPAKKDKKTQTPIALSPWMRDAIAFIGKEETDRTGGNFSFANLCRRLIYLGILRWREIRRLPEDRE